MEKKCKKLGNRATQRELKEAHRAKMEMKAAINASREPQNPFVLANLSQHHPEYGETPKQQTDRMLKKSS